MRAFFAEVGRKRPRVAYVGAASGDDPAFFAAMRARLQAAGAGEVELVPLCGAAQCIAEALRVVARADAIFISGGDVATGMDVLRSRKAVLRLLRERFASGTPFMGLSAGSIMLARGWVRWADGEGLGENSLFRCLAFAPIYCDVHGEADGWEELETLLRLLNKRAVGYAIPSGRALRIQGGVVAPVG
jgi:putative intracellular protease/amidase